MLFQGPFPLFVLTLVFLFVGVHLIGKLGEESGRVNDASPSWWSQWEWVFKAITVILGLIGAVVALFK
jgi:hypothetical protein